MLRPFTKYFLSILILLFITTNISFAQMPEYPKPKLIEAAMQGDMNLMQSLIKQGHDVNLKEEHSDSTPLIYASALGHLKVVQFLIKSGANVNQPDVGGDTPLFFASQNGNTKIMDILIKAGANINHKNGSGETALYQPTNQFILAKNPTTENYLGAIRLLIEQGVSLDDKKIKKLDLDKQPIIKLHFLLGELADKIHAGKNVINLMKEIEEQTLKLSKVEQKNNLWDIPKNRIFNKIKEDRGIKRK